MSPHLTYHLPPWPSFLNHSILHSGSPSPTSARRFSPSPSHLHFRIWLLPETTAPLTALSNDGCFSPFVPLAWRHVSIFPACLCFFQTVVAPSSSKTPSFRVHALVFYLSLSSLTAPLSVLHAPLSCCCDLHILGVPIIL